MDNNSLTKQDYTITTVNDEYYDNDYYYDSDEEYEETEQEKLINSINFFLDNNYYNIILLLDDIKSRFFL
jgi:hypothetical protein